MKYLASKQWIASGVPGIWLSAGAVSCALIMVFGLVALIAVKGLAHFWPGQVVQLDYLQAPGQSVTLLGEITARGRARRSEVEGAIDVSLPPGQTHLPRRLFKTGNRDYMGQDFRWLFDFAIRRQTVPAEAVAMERRKWGNLYGYLVAVRGLKTSPAPSTSEDTWAVLQSGIETSNRRFDEIRALEKGRIQGINYKLEKLRLKERRLHLENQASSPALAEIERERRELNRTYEALHRRLEAMYLEHNRASVTMRLAGGREVEFPLSRVVRAWRPNSMSLTEKLGLALEKVWEFVSDEPREANTEGGVFPAIFGTVAMVLLMTVFVTPLGVITAVYLREYARQGWLTRLVRISVHNLAGVPSVVYGVFGLSFFVYYIGGGLDRIFYPEALPAPTLGTPGLLWASLTLALLTVPVVIVSTEEGLARVPLDIREGSLALGATRAETIWRAVLPMALPSVMTGIILAIARAAGEVAPLMLVGVVKLAPALPLDGNPPYLHLERKFMHLGFHIYDMGFQSPNVEAARPLVYATALLLLLLILVLTPTAIYIRNKLRVRYAAQQI